MPTVVLQFLVGLISYMFPYEVVAKILVMLFDKLAKATTFTDFDDKVVKVLKDRLGMPEEVSKDDSDAS